MKKTKILLAIIGIMLAMMVSAQWITPGYAPYSPYFGNYHYANNYYTGPYISPGYTNGNYVQLGFQTPYGGMGLSVGWQNTPSTTVASTPEVIWIDQPASTSSGDVTVFNYSSSSQGGLAMDEYPQYKTLVIYPERCRKRKWCRSW